MALVEFLGDQIKPKIFNPYDKNNVLAKQDEDFQMMVLTLQDSGAKYVKEMTLYEFYSTIKYYEKKFKNGRKPV